MYTLKAVTQVGRQHLPGPILPPEEGVKKLSKAMLNMVDTFSLNLFSVRNSVCSLFLLFNACILRYYLSKPLTSLSCSLNAVFPGLKIWDTFACATANFLTHFIISIAVL
jgi:hypothetical protein